MPSKIKTKEPPVREHTLIKCTDIILSFDSPLRNQLQRFLSGCCWISGWMRSLLCALRRACTSAGTEERARKDRCQFIAKSCCLEVSTQVQQMRVRTAMQVQTRPSSTENTHTPVLKSGRAAQCALWFSRLQVAVLAIVSVIVGCLFVGKATCTSEAGCVRCCEKIRSGKRVNQMLARRRGSDNEPYPVRQPPPLPAFLELSSPVILSCERFSAYHDTPLTLLFCSSHMMKLESSTVSAEGDGAKRKNQG